MATTCRAKFPEGFVRTSNIKSDAYNAGGGHNGVFGLPGQRYAQLGVPSAQSTL